MTSQTKKFIEFADIVGIQLQCKIPTCGISLLVSGDALVTLSDPNNTTLAKCPTCGTPWTVPGTYPAHKIYDTKVKEFVRMLAEMCNVNGVVGCGIRLEIKDETIKP